MDGCKILFLAANPQGTSPLALDKEIREIEAKIRASEHRDSVNLVSKWAVRPDDLLQALNEHGPQVVHFSGHGQADSIVLMGANDQLKPVGKEALAYLFGTLKDNIRLVLLNACDSLPQAELITQHIDCVIGMNKPIGDAAAIVFAASFYRAIGFGRSIQEAFEQGRSALMLEGIPEENTPELILRPGVDPAEIVLVKPQVSTGRDASGNAFVTGDNNEVKVFIFQSVTEHREPEETSSAEIGPNPYMGLLAFHESDADRFFGREKQVSRLWEKLRDMQQNSPSQSGRVRLLPILGPSGSGKSSLARAGLIPELARRPLPGWKNARVAVLTPGSHPVEALAGVLARIATGDSVPVAKTREFTNELKMQTDDGKYDGLRRIADALPEIDSLPLIVLIDQFEEVYSLCQDKQERTSLIENLLHAASDISGRVSVVITLRTDFLGETQQHAALNALICSEEQHVMVPAMTEEELRAAIKKPADAAGHPLDEATVALLINDTKDREGALPLLQFALTRIWDGLTDGIEPAATYRSIGGVGGALAGEAQRIYNALSDADKRIAKRVFLGLVQLGEGTRDTRRRAAVRNLVSVNEDSSDLERVIRAFAGRDTRLLTLSADERGTADTAEVTHEALFDHWDQLNDWLAENREDIRFSRRLDDEARRWDQQQRPDGALWRPPNLDLLRQFRNRCESGTTPLQLTPLQQDFFVASDKAEKERIAHEQRQQTSLRRRLRLAVSAAIAAALMAAVAGGLGVMAERHRRIAQEALLTGKKAVDEMLMNVASEDLNKVPGMEGVARELLGKASEFYEDFRGQDPADPVWRMQTALAERYLGDMHRVLGDTAKADEYYTRAIGQFHDLRKLDPDEPKYQQHLANTHNWVGELWREKNGEDARSRLAQANSSALRLQERLVRDFQTHDDFLVYWYELARSHNNRGAIYLKEYLDLNKQHKKALAEQDNKALQDKKALAVQAFTLVIAMLDPQAPSSDKVDLRYYLKTYRDDKSEDVVIFEHYLKSLNLGEAPSANFSSLKSVPSMEHLDLVLAWSYQNRAALREFDEAQGDYDQALIAIPATASDRRSYQEEFAKVHNNWGILLRQQVTKSPEEREATLLRALEHNQQAIEGYKKLVAASPQLRNLLANAYITSGAIQQNLSHYQESEHDRRQEAARLYERAFEQFLELFELDPNNVDYIHRLGMSICNLAELHLAMKENASLDSKITPSRDDHDLSVASHAQVAEWIEKLDVLGEAAKPTRYERAAWIMARCVLLARESEEPMAKYAQLAKKQLDLAIQTGANREQWHRDKRYDPLRDLGDEEIRNLLDPQ